MKESLKPLSLLETAFSVLLRHFHDIGPCPTPSNKSMYQRWDSSRAARTQSLSLKRVTCSRPLE